MLQESTFGWTTRARAPRTGRSRAARVLVAGLLSGAWLVGAAGFAGCKPKAEATVAPPPAGVHVATATVTEQVMPRSLALTGTLRGQRQTDLAANANGRVIETFVERGAEVKKGDMIARLDTRAVQLTATEAQANVALSRKQETTAKRECERYKRLLEQNAISQAEYDKAADQCETSPLSVAAAEARARAAAQIVGDGSIRAPFGGLVTERFIEAGEFVHQDTKIVSLVDVSTLRLEVNVPEANITSVKVGGTVEFTVPAYGERRFKGTVKYMSAALREATRDLAVEALVDNADRALLPGMFAAIEVVTGEEKVPVVSKRTLLLKEGTTRVYAVVDKRLEERVVQVGVARDGVVSIVRGAKPGDVLVLDPTDKLLNGQPVE
jgi:RND family efflux transporter MFP subunit